MGQNLKAHLALLFANLIYGVNYIIAKDVMPEYLEPLGFIMLRAIGALIIFWLVASIFTKSEVEKKDLVKIALCALFGVAVNQMFFFLGLNITTPINASIIMTSTPVLVLIVAAILIKERITTNKILGITLGMAGALTLLLVKGDVDFGANTFTGDFLVLINALSYGVYLVMVKPLMRKYEPLVIIKWVFLFGTLYILPFGLSDALSVDYAALPGFIWGEIAFVVIGTTVFAYFLNIFALRSQSPAVVSTYLYLQPIFASIIALALGKDELTWIKIISAVLIFVGVYLVSIPRPHKT